MDNDVTENEKLTRAELKIRCADMAVKFKFLFIVTVVSFVINFILTIPMFMTIWALNLVLVIVYVSLKMLADVMIAIILFTLSKHNAGYKIAGIIYLIYAVLFNTSPLFLALASGQNAKIMVLLSEGGKLSSTLFNFLYHLQLSTTMMLVFEPVSLAVKVAWREFRQWNIYIFVGSLICTPLMFIPWVKYAALIGAGIITTASFIVLIWRFTIIFKSYKMMEKFSRQVESPTPPHE